MQVCPFTLVLKGWSIVIVITYERNYFICPFCFPPLFKSPLYHPLSHQFSIFPHMPPAFSFAFSCLLIPHPPLFHPSVPASLFAFLYHSSSTSLLLSLPPFLHPPITCLPPYFSSSHSTYFPPFLSPYPLYLTLAFPHSPPHDSLPSFLYLSIL